MSWKLSRHAFTRFWDVHAWAGVVTSLVLYVMFLLGSVVLFYRPLTIWEEPILQSPAPTGHALQATLALAEPLPEEFYLYLPYEGHGLPKVGYYLPGTSQWHMWWLDVERGRQVPERELAAAYVYDLHYLWNNATGFWLQYGGGVLVFGFLLTLVTGVLVHLQNLVPQLHRFRPERGRRTLWSDLHKVAGVMGLPFQLVYALTGALLVLSPLLFQLSIGPLFQGDEQRAADAAGALIEDPPPREYGGHARALPLDELVARAAAAEPRLIIESFIYRGYGREHGSVDVRGQIDGATFGDATVTLTAATGAVELVQTPDAERSVATLARWIHGLHTVHYGGLEVRLLLWLLAIAGCVTILSGNWIWLERRRVKQPSSVNGLLARLTAGVGGGSVLALGSLFLASRMLPLEWPRRLAAEEIVLASSFIACLLYAFAARSSAAIWWRLLGLAALVFLATPLAATLRSPAGLFGAGPRLATVVGVDIGLLVASALLLTLAASIRRVQRGADSAPALAVSPAVATGVDA